MRLGFLVALYIITIGCVLGCFAAFSAVFFDKMCGGGFSTFYPIFWGMLVIFYFCLSHRDPLFFNLIYFVDKYFHLFPRCESGCCKLKDYKQEEFGSRSHPETWVMRSTCKCAHVYVQKMLGNIIYRASGKKSNTQNSPAYQNLLEFLNPLVI